MAERGKTIAEEGDLVDRISNLPINVINHILDFLPIKVVARTSVLSTNWRYFWASHPYIKIQHDLLETEKSDTWSAVKDSKNIINKILFQHIGPVLKFSFEFPWSQAKDFDVSVVNHGLLYLSKNGIRELTLNQCYQYEPYLLPSHIFFAPELVVLNLRSCSLNSPNVDGAFRKLKTLNLSHIHFLSCKITSAFNTPQLIFLRFSWCSKVCEFKIRAPKLETLIIERSTGVELMNFERSEITSITLIGRCTLKEMSLTEIFERWRRMSSFHVDGQCFKFLTADARLEMLPPMTSCLTHLVLTLINWSDLQQVSCILYLLRSSTCLSRLEISVHKFSQAPTDKVSNYLDAAHRMNWTINCLEIIVIQFPSGSEEEMRFVKLLLSCCPSLKKIYVMTGFDDSSSRCKLLKELVRFPRASKEAEIIFKTNVRIFESLRISSYYCHF